MNPTTTKNVRDGVLPTGIGTLVYGVVLHYTGDQYLAGVAAVLTGIVIAAAYRILRARLPWLAELDPGAEQLGAAPQVTTPISTTASSAQSAVASTEGTQVTPPTIGGTSAGG